MTTKTTTTKIDIYQSVTDSLIDLLEKGVTPWEPAYTAGNSNYLGLPLRSNNKPYQGINIMILWIESLSKGYQSNNWYTYKQAQDLGAQVRKGSKSATICYASSFVKDGEKEEDKKKIVPFLKTYAVFNADQIDGLPEVQKKEVSAIEKIANVEIFISNTQARIEYSDSVNCGKYFPESDFIVIPSINRYFGDTLQERYYSTLFHELGHWTGHPTRLNRVGITKVKKDKQIYALEELIAELSAAYSLANLEISKTPLEEHASYLQSWISALKGDKKFIFKAASAAQQATEYLKSLQPGYEKPN